MQPLRWKRPRRIFWNAHGDLFHENVPDEWIDRQFAVMVMTPQHTHMVLTKRPARMREYLTGPHVFRVADGIQQMPGVPDGWDKARASARVRSMEPLPNVWLGTSVEDQARADERIPDLSATPAAVRFISFEPLLGEVTADLKDIQWAIVGGESGPGARPMHPDWARSLRDQCAAAGVAFHFKQWGSWREAAFGDEFDTAKGRMNRPAAFIVKPDDGTVHCFLPEDADSRCLVMLEVGKKAAGRLLDGVQHDGVPG
jgi:protein gp37